MGFTAGTPGDTPYGDFNLGDHVGDAPASVEANRVALAATLGISRDHLVFMQQVHGNAVAVIDGPRTGAVEAVDALVTATPGLALVVLVADCVPVLLADRESGVVGVAHAGRRGVAGGVVAATVATMRDLGAGAIEARLGPHIGPCCYEVGEDVQAELPASAHARTRAGRLSLDLAAELRRQLHAAGVTAITEDERCTAEDGNLYSYRRDGVTGRFAGYAIVAPR